MCALWLDLVEQRAASSLPHSSTLLSDEERKARVELAREDAFILFSRARDWWSFTAHAQKVASLPQVQEYFGLGSPCPLLEAAKILACCPAGMMRECWSDCIKQELVDDAVEGAKIAGVAVLFV